MIRSRKQAIQPRTLDARDLQAIRGGDSNTAASTQDTAKNAIGNIR